jgi:hypothetical protein
MPLLPKHFTYQGACTLDYFMLVQFWTVRVDKFLTVRFDKIEILSVRDEYGNGDVFII